jgi:hypothetical protein
MKRFRFFIFSTVQVHLTIQFPKMKKVFLSFLIIAAGCTKIAGTESIIPATWEKDFSIELYTGGGMVNQSTTITYRYDSAIYNHKIQNMDSVKSFALTEEDRKTILTELKLLNLDKVQSVDLDHIVYDKETVRICLTNTAKDFCLDEGSSTEIIDPDKSFTGAWHYLEKMIMERGH